MVIETLGKSIVKVLLFSCVFSASIVAIAMPSFGGKYCSKYAFFFVSKLLID